MRLVRERGLLYTTTGLLAAAVVWLGLVVSADVGDTTRVSVNSDGTEGNSDSIRPSVSADGGFVAFASDSSNLVEGDSNGSSDVFVHDMDSGVTSRVSVDSDGTEGNSHSIRPSVSADGGFVAFDSDASNLVAGDGNGSSDVFVHDVDSGETVRVSVSSDGTEGNSDSVAPSVSADGGFVAFESFASNLVGGDGNGSPDVFVHDMDS
ncbi:MAG: hypothetical protein GEU79_09070, partial [Acidimicrobiia bacterium]|nr:hypothetical protein [Acidimicrobiia bacterium]